MLTLEDCEDFSDLSKEEIEAIAAHEHMAEINATALGNRLVHSDAGLALIKRYILEDAEQAKAHGDSIMATHWRDVYRHFVAAHPGR